MNALLEGAGLFVYPLLACSVVGLLVILERVFVLLTYRVVPRPLIAALAAKKIPAEPGTSVLGRLVSAAGEVENTPETVRALARVEMNRLERGLVILEIVIAIAPLLGLLGTVSGLIKVFANISPETGMPEPSIFVEGVAMALVTTGLGLAIAIPSLVFHGYFQRKAETFMVEIESALDLLNAVQRETPPESKKSA